MLKLWRERVLLIIGGLLVALLLVEIVLRIIGFEYPTVYVADARHGYRLLPNASGWWTTEGTTYIHINRDGWRDKEHSKQKPPNTFRIAILGDSFAEAFQVSQEETFWHLMEQSLNDRNCFDGQPVEVLNFGVGGYGTAQQLLVLQNDVWVYDPDLILLVMFLGNDLKDNVALLNQRSEYAYYIYNNGQLEPDPNFPEKKLLHLRQVFGYSSNYLRVLGVLNMMWKTARLQIRQPPVVDATWDEVGIDKAVLKPPTSPIWHEAWQVTEGLLTLIRDEVKAHNAELQVVTISTSITVNPDPALRAELQQLLNRDDLFYPDQRFESFARDEAIPILSLGPPFQAHAEQHQVFLHGFENGNLGSGHWNQAGHQLAGELITRELCE